MRRVIRLTEVSSFPPLPSVKWIEFACFHVESFASSRDIPLRFRQSRRTDVLWFDDLPVPLNPADEQKELKAPPERPRQLRVARHDARHPAREIPRDLLTHKYFKGIVIVERGDESLENAGVPFEAGGVTPSF